MPSVSILDYQCLQVCLSYRKIGNAYLENPTGVLSCELVQVSLGVNKNVGIHSICKMEFQNSAMHCMTNTFDWNSGVITD